MATDGPDPPPCDPCMVHPCDTSPENRILAIQAIFMALDPWEGAS